MIESNKIRWVIILFSLVLAGAWMLPNFYTFKEDQWWVSKEKLIYGLDIQGGLHLVMGVKTDEAIQEKVKSLIADLKDQLEKSEIKVAEIVSLKEKIGQIRVSLNKAEDREKAEKVIEKEYTGSILGGARLRILSRSGEDTFTLGYNEVELIRLRKGIANQVVEVIRRRIDEFGVSEPVITVQGDDRVLVQLPGVEDSARARDIIQRTAKLEFRLVNQEVPTEQLIEWIQSVETEKGYSLNLKLPYSEYVQKINEDLKDKIPENHILVFQRAESSNSLQAGKIPVLVRTDSGAGGEILQTAFVGVDEFNNPEVIFHINVSGRKTFSELTGNNIKKPLAIILDKELKSMPIIQSRISDRGSISMGRGQDIRKEAEDIAMVLRAGALPARLVKMEERTVGPTLGRDSIEKGKTAGLFAGVLVIIFMLLYYRTLGLVANVALCMNMLCLLALLTSLGATLTLPGVAGIILTIGMAVDANVIIYERLKEELRKGSALMLAVRDGYRYALSAILDANITTAIVCMVLISFGTGPIRGFAVTLFCGIITSIFTAVFVSRTVLHTLIRKFNLKHL